MIVERFDPFRWFVLGWMLEDNGMDEMHWKNSVAAQVDIDALVLQCNEMNLDTLKWLRKQFDSARKFPPEDACGHR